MENQLPNLFQTALEKEFWGILAKVILHLLICLRQIRSTVTSS